MAQQHKAFFRSPVRNTKLKELQRPNDDEAAVRMKMLAVLAKQPADIDKLLLHAFGQLDPAHFDADDLLPHARVFLSIWKDSTGADPADRYAPDAAAPGHPMQDPHGFLGQRNRKAPRVGAP